MPAVTVNEGEYKTLLNATDDFVYPNINSCLTITVTFTDGRREGGHAVMFPNPAARPAQLTLWQIYQRAMDAFRMARSRDVYVVGATTLWTNNWGALDQAAPFRARGMGSLAAVMQSFNAPRILNTFLNTAPTGDSVDVTFCGTRAATNPRQLTFRARPAGPTTVQQAWL